MFKTLILKLVFLTSIFCCAAQDKWEPGFIISIKGDTLHGFLENNDIRANIQFCNFRKSLEESPRQYGPQDVRGYRFSEGKFFITIHVGSDEFEGPVFMEYLIKGQANIYRYLNDRFFIETVDGMQELKNTEKDVEHKGDKYVQLKKEYVLILNYFMRDANMRDQIQSVRYNSKSLVNLAKRYHENVCNDEECIVYEKSFSRLKFRYRATGGLSFGKFNFGRISETNFSSGGYAGFGMELRNISPWVEKFSVSLDLVFSRQTSYNIQAISDQTGVPVTYEGEYFVLAKDRSVTFLGNNDPSASVFDEFDLEINPVSLSVPVVLNFYFSKGTVAPYVGLGGVAEFLLGRNEEFVYHHYQDGLGKSIPSTRFGVVGRLGATYRLPNGKEILFESNFQQARSLDANRSFRLQQLLITVGAGFSF